MTRESGRISGARGLAACGRRPTKAIVNAPTAGRIARRENTTFQCLGDRSHGTSNRAPTGSSRRHRPVQRHIDRLLQQRAHPLRWQYPELLHVRHVDRRWLDKAVRLVVRHGKARSGRPLGELVMHNTGGSMLVKVFQSATPGTDTYRVARASGNDTSYKGETGVLMITQNPTFRTPYYVSGQATMTFTPG